MKERRKFIHNKCVYVCTTHQKIGDSNYEKSVKIHFMGNVIIGWNAKNNTPMDEIIVQAKANIDSPNRLILQ